MSVPRHRLDAVRRALDSANVQGYLVASLANRRYLSGFTGSTGTLLVTAERQCLLADFRYWGLVVEQAPSWELVKVQRALHVPLAIADLVRQTGITSLGFESNQVSIDTLKTWLEACQDLCEFVPLAGLVESVRAVKDDQELATLRRAFAITDAAYAGLTTWLQEGMTEREVAWRLERDMRERGAEGMSFPVIVASGPNAAMPHARPTDRTIQRSETVIVDMGARVDGYCADLTRTFCLAPIPDRVRHVYNVVLQAQQAAIDGLRAGVTGKAVDSLARDHIAEFGFGDAFGHSLGHAVGLDEHEIPQLSQQNEQPLPAGVVETVEPGIYLPGWGGVRIEDVAIVGDGPPELLTKADRSLDWSQP